MPNNNDNPLVRIVQALFQLFCAGSSKPDQQQQYGNYNQQQQQQQHWNQQQYPPPQQQGGYPGQQQQGGYPGQQQQGYQQNQQSWSQVASGPPGSGPQHPNGQYQSHPNQHGGPHSPHQNNQHQNNYQQNQQQYQQNGAHPSKPFGLPAGGIIGPHHQHGQDPNMVNQANEKYVAMRNQARQEGDEAHRCFAASQEAYKSGDGAKAHELSVEGKAHAKKQDDIDEEAANWIYYANNTDSPPGTIDLHGLYVQEAITRTETAITQAQQSGQEEIQIIVGKGIHSKGHQAKIKPAVEDLMRKYNLSAHLDPHNAGVLVVDLQGRQINGRTRDAGGLVDEMERSDGNDCIIM